jgi:hypothetical protein
MSGRLRVIWWMYQAIWRRRVGWILRAKMILMTNDGELANLLRHPKFEFTKECKVLLARHPNPDKLERGSGEWIRKILRLAEVRYENAQGIVLRCV